MADLKALEAELRRRGKTEALQKLAATAEGQRLAAALDADTVAAAGRGDGTALSALLRGVLGTDEGRQLLRRVEELMKD